ncbi:MAG: signal peptidase Serine peptidase family [Moraxellaceae bacterium]|jgi:signal peptidase I|nr:signal peptidase Serine peptidase family [Moraxellaceae bacterium]
MTLMQLLTIVLAIATTLWALETFIALPLRQRQAAARLAAGEAPDAGALRSLVAEPPLSKLMANVVVGILGALFLLVILMRQDVDFSLVLVVATAVTGLFWLLYVTVTRRFRVALLAAAGQKEEVPAGQPGGQPALVEYSASFFPVLAVVLLLRSFLFEPFTIPSGSMLPTLQIGDYILVNKYAYGLRLPVAGTEILAIGKPQRGDVMVFKYPENPRQNFIKRVIGVPGDHVRVEGNRVFVNNEELPRVRTQFEGAESWELYYKERVGEREFMIRHEEGREISSPLVDQVVPPDSYFMLGDNRDNSRDSRYWGFVPDRYIVGKASLIWMHKDPGLHLPTFGRDGKVQ